MVIESVPLPTLGNEAEVIYPAPFVIALLFNDMLAEPLKLTPAIVLAVCSVVAVAALPVQEPEEPDTVVCTIFGAVFVIVNVPPLEVEVSSDCIPVPCAIVTVSPFDTVLVSVPLPSFKIQVDIEPPEDVTYPESFVH